MLIERTGPASQLQRLSSSVGNAVPVLKDKRWVSDSSLSVRVPGTIRSSLFQSFHLLKLKPKRRSRVSFGALVSESSWGRDVNLPRFYHGKGCHRGCTLWYSKSHDIHNTADQHTEQSTLVAALQTPEADDGDENIEVRAKLRRRRIGMADKGKVPRKKETIDRIRQTTYQAMHSPESLTAVDIAKGLLDVQGWKVLTNETGEEVGVVQEIIHIGSADSDEIFESVLKLVQVSPLEAKTRYELSADEDSDNEDGLEFLVPLVEDIVKSVDINLRCLLITPPAGLLELARIPEILKRLEPQLLEFCQHQNAGILSCLDSVEAHQSTRFSDDAKQLVEWSGHIQPYKRDVFMPTRKQLLSVGRHDLVKEVMAAGGFLSVAQALGLRSRRRPVGFWDNLRNLDAEIEWFVCGYSVVQQSPETGEEIYYNQVTNEYSRQKPSGGNVSDPVPVSQEEVDVGTAVMPRQQQVLEAGRSDLHHAILSHGGYKLVARELGRQPVSRDTRTKLVAKLREFMEENSFSTFPSFDELRALERYDLVSSLRKHGGINSVAQMMDLRPKRYGKGQWNSLDCAAAAIRSYMCNKIISERGFAGTCMDRCDLEDAVWNEAVKAGTLEIPTEAYFLRDGRSDLRYLSQKYGRKDLAEYLGIKYLETRGRKKKSGVRASTR